MISKKGIKMKNTYFNNYLNKKAAEDDRRTNADFTHAIPLIGGAINGLVDPARGNSRIESGAIQGLAGFGGGIAGGATGLGVGMYAADRAGLTSRDTGAKVLAIAATLLGASLGTAIGSGATKWASKRDVMTPTDWKNLSSPVYGSYYDKKYDSPRLTEDESRLLQKQWREYSSD